MADTDDTPEVETPEVEQPRGRTSLWNIILLFFNVVALVGFGAILYIDMSKRLEWAEGTLLRQLAINGLPVDERDDGAVAEQSIQIRHELDPALLKEAYEKRQANVKDKFQAVNESFKDYVS